MAAHKVSIINMKGGVGKTTLSINLAKYLSELMHYKVLLLDLDPQANATIVGISKKDLAEHKKSKKTVADLFINCLHAYGPFTKPVKSKIKLEEYVHRSFESTDKKYYLDIIPSEIILSSVLRGVNLGPYELNKLLVDQAEKKYDFIIVDCAPTYSILTTLALNATKAVMIPVMSDSFGVYGVELMKHVLAEHKFDYGVDINIIGLVFTMWKEASQEQHTRSSEIIKSWGFANTFRTKISANDWYKIANGNRQNIWNTPAHKKYKAEFDEFVVEFLKKFGI